MAAATGSKKIAIVLINFSNDRSQPYTPAYAAGIAFTNTNSVAAYYADSSWGQLTITGDVFGWYTIPDSNTSCNTDTWASSANKAAATAGVNLSAYTNVVYAFPLASSCAWSGWADLPGTRSWLNGYGSTGGMSLHGMAHELGHNFGTNHASSLICTENGVRVSLSANPANCTRGEYGDPFSVMGSASHYDQTNFSRGNLGWLHAASTLDVTGSGDYLLQPVEFNDPSAVQVLRIQRTTSTYFTLEFRQPSSIFDTFPLSDPGVTGITIRITPGYGTTSQSQLVDTTPGSSMSFFDAPLAVGKTLVDPLTGISITDLGVSSFGATVRISLAGGAPQAADTTPPSQPGSLTATAVDASHVSLNWAASTDNVGVAGYRVYRGGTLAATVTSTSYTDGGLAAGTAYSYQVIAFDAAGSTSTAASISATTASISATTPAPDTQGPTSPGNLTASALDSSRVSLTWAASSDNVGVAGYRLYRDGVLVTTVTTTGYTDGGLAAGTSYAYQVIAFDAAGNVSPAAAGATATTVARDTTPPSAPTNLTATVSKGKKVALTWNASSDDISVAGYSVYRDGNVIGTTPGTSFSDALGGRTATATYYVVAYDAAGNVSAPSGSVTAAT